MRETLSAVLSKMGFEALLAPCRDAAVAFERFRGADIAVCEMSGDPKFSVAELEGLLADNDVRCVLLALASSQLPDAKMPNGLPSDFVLDRACAGEHEARISLLLGAAAPQSDVVSVGDMTINLATYQVAIAGEPLDFTYLEYALLAFLVTHAERTYSRDALLHHVWGFDYYGGSRTVDVHVRRVRAKLGPELAQHLETVRGVGYLWSN